MTPFIVLLAACMSPKVIARPQKPPETPWYSAKEPWGWRPSTSAILPIGIPLAWPNRQRFSPTKNGTSVTVPDEYWMTSGYFDVRHSPELAKYLEQDLPLNPNTRPWFDIIGTLYNDRTIGQLARSFLDTPITPSINGMIRAQNLWRFVYMMMDVPVYCMCSVPLYDPTNIARLISPEGNCSPKAFAQELGEGPPWQNVAKAQFDAVVDILSNHSIVEKMETLKVFEEPPNDQDKLLAKAADIPISITQTLHGQLIKMQYALYQNLVRGDSNSCAIPVVECGRHGYNPCDKYPPSQK